MKRSGTIVKDLSDAIYKLGRVSDTLARKGSTILPSTALKRCVELVHQSRFDLEHVRRVLYGEVLVPEGQADDRNGDPEPDRGGGNPDPATGGPPG